MKKYCHNCGRETTGDDKYCHNCGVKLEDSPSAANAPKLPQTDGRPAANPNASAQPQEENKVRYVQVDTKTGKIAQNPKKTSGSESMMQGLTIAFVAIAVVIVMIAGSMFISGHISKNVTSNDEEDDYNIVSEMPVVSETSSEEETVSSEDIQQEEVSSIPPELQADYLRSKIKGKWSTQLPYKAMSLPVTFTFDDAGNCSCVIKALFITKQFDGQYSVQDGGACTITLNGLEEYMSEGNSLTGSIAFISDDKVNFTAGNEIWVLNRVE